MVDGDIASAGTVEYKAVPGLLLPYFCWGVRLHVGKASAFGLGKYRIVEDVNLPSNCLDSMG